MGQNIETKEWQFEDIKEKLPEGPWQAEPDKMQWSDPYSGLPCLIVRNPDFGNLCGYVGVSKDHPLFGKDYEKCDLECHGGLTFSGACRENDKEHGICHITPDEEAVWWFGFDCAHYHDIFPSFIKLKPFGITSLTGNYGETYKDIAYVKNECQELAKQLKAV